MMPATYRSSSRLGRRVVLFLIFVAGTVWVLPTLRGTAAQTPPQEPAGSQAVKGTIRVRVELPDGRPAVGAKILANITPKDRPISTRPYTCDGSGAALVEMPRAADILILRLWARMDGYVPLFANWWRPGPEGRLEPVTRDVPEEFTFKLIRGTSIGGVVKDERGKPIPGVRVEVKLASQWERPDERPTYDISLADADTARTTDVQGRWTLDNVAPGSNADVFIKLTHPDFISDYQWGGMQGIEKVSMASLRQQSAEFVMARGIRVSGTITDSAGKPVPGAVVVWGNDPHMTQGIQEVRTDERGVYRFAPLPPMPMAITVIAPGWSTEMKRIDITFENPPVNFKVKAGKALRLRFVDDDGAAIPGVFVYIDGWRGRKSLYNRKHPSVLDTRIPIMADTRGVYEWNWAPEDEVEYSFYKQGYHDARSQRLTADGAEHEVRLLAHFADKVQASLQSSKLTREQAITELQKAGAEVRFRPEGNEVFAINLKEKKLGDTVISCVGRVPETHLVDLARTDVSDAGLAGLGPLRNLEWLILTETGISDAGAKQICNHKSLWHLNLGGTKITDDAIPELAKLPRLTELMITGNTRITDLSVERLVPLKTLKKLYLNGTRVTDDGLRHLKEFPNLQTIGLYMTAITDEGVRRLVEIRSLRHIELNDTRITTVSLDRLGIMPNLEHLEVSSNKGVSKAAVEAFRKAHPRCTVEAYGQMGP